MTFSQQQGQILLNSLTSSRMLVCLCVFFFKQEYVLIVCLYAGVTDYLDGFLARKYNLRSKLGGKLDQVSDKIFHSILFLYLWQRDMIHSYFFFLFLLREVAILVLRSTGTALQLSNFYGKLKTVLCYVFIVYLVGADFFHFSGLLSGFMIIGIELTILIISYYSILRSLKKDIPK